MEIFTNIADDLKLLGDRTRLAMLSLLKSGNGACANLSASSTFPSPPSASI